jgi:hypothetical protein
MYNAFQKLFWINGAPFWFSNCTAWSSTSVPSRKYQIRDRKLGLYFRHDVLDIPAVANNIYRCSFEAIGLECSDSVCKTDRVPVNHFTRRYRVYRARAAEFRPHSAHKQIGRSPPKRRLKLLPMGLFRKYYRQFWVLKMGANNAPCPCELKSMLKILKRRIWEHQLAWLLYGPKKKHTKKKSSLVIFRYCASIRFQ